MQELNCSFEYMLFEWNKWTRRFESTRWRLLDSNLACGVLILIKAVSLYSCSQFMQLSTHRVPHDDIHAHSCVKGRNRGHLFVLPFFGRLFFRLTHWFCSRNRIEEVLGATLSRIPFVITLSKSSVWLLGHAHAHSPSGWHMHTLRTVLAQSMTGSGLYSHGARVALGRPAPIALYHTAYTLVMFLVSNNNNEC